MKKQKPKPMKHFTLLLIISLAIGCVPETQQLDGTWIPTAQEMGGKAFPPEVVQTQKLIIADSTYTLTAESVDKGTLKYTNGKMDIYGKEGVNAGKHYAAIYKWDNTKKLLTICYNLSGDNVYPESFSTKDKPMYFLSVFKQQ